MDAVHVLSRRSGEFQHRYLYMNNVPEFNWMFDSPQ